MATQLTLTQIQKRIATEVDQTATTPTVGGSEWAYRLELINRAQDEWSMSHTWDSLRKKYTPNVTGVSQGSISLPADFKELADFPVAYFTGENGGTKWPVIKVHEVTQKQPEDQFSYVIGNSGIGKTLAWNPATLASGATIAIYYHGFATSLASPSDITEIDEPEFLVRRVSAHILRTRNDSRFQTLEFEAREILTLSKENDNTQSYPVEDRLTTPEQRMGRTFRMGRD